MSASQFGLLTQRRFLPLFLTQFLGAFNDNVFKNALVILITYQLAEASHLPAQMLVTVAAGVFILPFFLFSSTAGLLSDKYEKSFLIRKIKLAEIVIVILASIAFYSGSVWLLLFVLFSLGVQSAFFGPLKYSILPQHLAERELVGGNGLIEAATFLAILLGTIVGGLLILTQYGIGIISTLIIGLAILGWLASFYIPEARSSAKELSFSFNFIKATWDNMLYAKRQKSVFLAILGISWFWFVGATFLAQFPTYAKQVLNANEQVVTLFLFVFSVGIGVGSILCNRLLKGQVSVIYVPFAALGMTAAMVDLYFASHHAVGGSATALINAWQFIESGQNWRILLDLSLIAIFGGLYTVPLYAFIQTHSSASHLSRMIASNNVMNSLFMVVSALATMLMFTLHYSVVQVFLCMAMVNAIVAIYICKLLPEELFRSFMRVVLTFLFKVKLEGLDNYEQAGKRVLIVANHTSFLDALLIATFLPKRVSFVVDSFIAQQWWVKIGLNFVDAFELNPLKPMTTKSLINYIKENKQAVIFPEGRITVTGSLMKVYEGPGFVADKSDAVILPIRIDGAQYSIFSRLKGKVRRHIFPKVKLTILPPTKLEMPAKLTGRDRRHYAGRQLYQLMTEMMFESSEYRRILFASLLDAKTINGGKHVIAEDAERKPITVSQLITRSFILSKKLKMLSHLDEAVGVLLPNSITTTVVFFALHACGRIPTMLNFSAGSHTVLGACNTACVKNILTSKQFIERAKLEPLIELLASNGISIHYLEDVAATINLTNKIMGIVAGSFPRIYYRFLRQKHKGPDKPAVILFTSGSEGTPKAVVLSHSNLQANRHQMSAKIDFGPSDVIFNALPMFHAFGLTGGTILPVLAGVKVFLYPSPLHYRIIPELAYASNATIIFGTDTFLSGYAKYAHPYDFYSVRYVFSGAEKLRAETRKLWSEKFGVRVFEGYGATETAPLLAANTPMQYKLGTVGCFLPSIEYELKPIPDLHTGGELWVKGPNIMLGYYLVDNPGVLVPPKDGWYDTGDIVTIDDEGFITIAGRTKRFVKIAGEMVSLPAVENYLAELWPEFNHAVVSRPDPDKGERLILVTTNFDAAREQISKYTKSQGLSELMIPREIKIVKELPLLGSGKVDYKAVEALLD